MSSTDEIAALKAEILKLQEVIKAKELETDIVDPFSRMFERTSITSILKASDGGLSLVGRSIVVGGWVKTARKMKGDDGHLGFLDLNDGSCFPSLQVLVSSKIYDVQSILTTGTAVCVRGTLQKAPEDKEQAVELHVEEMIHHGPSDGKTYPISKGKVKDPKKAIENLRNYTHLRPRTNVTSAIARIRHALAICTHDFYNKHGFLYVHAPLITQSDCEGAGEMFQLTTLLDKATPMPDDEVADLTSKLDQMALEVAKQGDVVKEYKTAKRSKETIKKEVEKLLELKKDLGDLSASVRASGGLPRLENKDVDYNADFFGKPSFLTVSGQLHVENYCCALSNVYTFGPTFRAEKSLTKKHLAEFWMIEPEIAFADLKDAMNLSEAYIKACCQYLLDNYRDDLEFLAKFTGHDTLGRLENVVGDSFARVTYTEAIDILKAAIEKKEVDFEFEVEWGVDLKTEHESYLAAKVFNKPTIVYNYPAEIKSFYMRMNEDGKTVAAMDILVPEVGELVGGSQREERLDVLTSRMAELSLDEELYTSYLDLRRYGSVPHSGFGVGFERLLMFTTRLDNIRDIIPFPRWYKHLDD